MAEVGESAVLEALLLALAKVTDSLSLPQLIALATVALKPGLSVNDLAEQMSIPQQTASRHVAVLLGRYQDLVSTAPTEPLISQGVSADDPRKRALFISHAGSDLLTKITSPLERLTSKGN